MEAGALQLTDTARLHGDLIYESDAPLQRHPGAVVRGTVTRASSASSETKAMSLIRDLVGWLPFGLAFVFLSRGFGRRTLQALAESPWRSLGRGLLTLVGVPAIGFVAFALSLEIGGWWLVILAPALFALSLALGFVVSAEFAGGSILAIVGLRDETRTRAALLGLILLVTASRVLYVGLPLTFAAVAIGLGALTNELVRTQRERIVA